MIMIKAVIFDFDGTMVNSYNTVNQVHYKLLNRYRIEQLMPEDIAFMGSLTRNHRLNESTVAKSTSRLLDEAKIAYKTCILKSPLQAGMRELFLALLKAEIELFIVSRNSANIIERFLLVHDCLFFTEVYGDVTTAKKQRVLLKLLKKYHYSSDEVICVGDEINDLDACKKSKLEIVLVTWGYSHKEMLARYQYYSVVDTVEELKSQLLKN